MRQYRQSSHWPVTIVVMASALALGFWKNGRSVEQTTTPHPPPSRASEAQPPQVKAASTLEAGRYIVSIGGCNDCHTAGFAMKNGQVPESDWLLGDVVGYRGPWGTSYPANLRLTVKDVSEDVFVATMKQRTSRPPMVWPALHAMSDVDLRAVYQYLKALGPAGKPAPEYVAPGETPKTPYINLVPVIPQGSDVGG